MEERRARLLRETICRQNVAHNKWTRELWTRTHAQWSETVGAHARTARTLREIPAIGFSRPSYDNRFFFSVPFFFFISFLQIERFVIIFTSDGRDPDANRSPSRTTTRSHNGGRPFSGEKPCRVSVYRLRPGPARYSSAAADVNRGLRAPLFIILTRVSPLSTRTPARHPHHSPPHDREHIFQVSPLMLLLLHGLRRLATTRTIDRASVVVVGTWLGVVVDSNRPDVPEFPFPGTAVRSLHVFSVVPIDCQSHRLRV